MYTPRKFPAAGTNTPLTDGFGAIMILSVHRDASAVGISAARSRRCHHFPRCPAATAADRHAARTIAAHPEQGWSLLCNGIVLFDDNGELIPAGSAATRSPRRAAAA